MDSTTVSDLVAKAWEVANGRATGEETAQNIRGAVNDYNSRGNGSTMARRVLRNGSWEWVSAPASRSRYLAGDRRDVQRGDVYEGEIVAEYTLGSKKPTPDQFWLVTTENKPLTKLGHAKIKTGYRLTLRDETLDVSDPSWR